MSTRVLQDLARLYDITVKSSREPTGRKEEEDDRLLAILQAAGVPVTSHDDGADLLREREKKQRQQVLDPVRVISDRDMPLCLTVRLAARGDHRYRWTVTEENGRQHSGSFSRSDVTAAPDPDHCLLALHITLPCGYHQVTIEGGQPPYDTAATSMLLIVAPAHCYLSPAIAGDDRAWGIGCHLHALRARHNWGIGDFAGLQQLLAWSAARGAAILQVAPMHCFNSAKFPNPYLPSCRTGLNVLFINIDNVADFAENEDIRHHVGDARFQARLASLNSGQQIDYQGVAEMKGAVLKKLWYHFQANHLEPESPRGKEFRDFQQKGGESARFQAIFAALQEERFAENIDGHDWRTWPVALRTPHSQTVAAFASDHQQLIEYHQYLQWQAELQLAAAGNRSMELGLKIGLLTEFPYACDPSGFESWYYDGLLLPAASMARTPADGEVLNPAEGQPLISPSRLKDHRYQPFIDGLRHTMRYAGAVVIRSFANYFSAPIAVSGQTADPEALITYPFTDLLAILTLESRRNRCQIIADNIDRLPAEMRREVRRRNIFTSTGLFQARDEQGNWVEPDNYPADSVVSTSPPFLAAMSGVWQGWDISLKTAENFFLNEAEKEQALLYRVADRARFLLGLDRAGLLPDGCAVDPAANVEMTLPLVKAGLILLAKSPAKILVVSLNDLLGTANQAEPPIMRSQEFWHLRYEVELEQLAADGEINAIFQALYRERGSGVVHSSASRPDRKKEQILRLPTAFYRLQLNKDFTFRQATEILPYLRDLGISHCYTSPFLQARPGSPHGYDIIDHCSLNPEIGSEEDFTGFLAALQANRMELLLDIVPNHMAIGSDNQWWMDVLENGQSSQYAIFFDINWQPQQMDMIGRILLPVLGDHYGKILESGQLTLRFNKGDGTFAIAYYDHRFPVDPGTYWAILHYDLQRLRDRLGKRHDGYLELHNLISSSENLPGRQETTDERVQIRRRDQEVSKRMLARLCRDWPEVHQFIAENVILFNGEVGRSQSFDLLHDLLEKQAYRLAFWRVAADEINYRRFFDINHLAALRMEEAEVFHETHRYILDLIGAGKVDGLRIDHPDGLYDPRDYFCRLAAAASGQVHDTTSTMNTEHCKGKRMPLYLVAEKILADFEHLPGNWPLHGTTGYDFSNLLNGLLVDSAAEKEFTTLYHRFVGSRSDFEELVYGGKKLIIESAMAGELTVLVTLLFRLARSCRVSRDYTLNRLRQALIEIIACFPVYRTYIDSEHPREEDVRVIERAVTRAKTRQQPYDLGIFDFIKSVLLLEPSPCDEDTQKRLNFVLKFQQYTGPVMAKGMEDTAFYIYNRLLSLNEVGGEPKRFGISPAAFHRTNQDRMQHWPHAMLNTSTHDSKRSEDVRSRINVLTEMVPAWRQQVFRWRSLNRRLRNGLDGKTAPGRNDEYAFYQTLLGVWPVEALDEEEHNRVIERIKDGMLKACREAKVHTSWISANESYEKTISDFVEKSLCKGDNPFLEEFLCFQEEVAWFGMLNSLSQVFLKLVSPGIPDIYQGNELWRFCLVDPDNRRPVDYSKRQAMLSSMLERIKGEPPEREKYLGELLANLADGRAKMFIINGALRLRSSCPEVFARGSYIPLEVRGSKSRHLLAFARQDAKRVVVAAAPRLYFTLMEGARQLPLDAGVWEDTEICFPGGRTWPSSFENVYTSTTENGEEAYGESMIFRAARLLRSWPVALLHGTVA